MSATPWEEFQSALHRHGRTFDEIRHCEDRADVIKFLGFHDPLSAAAIASHWTSVATSSSPKDDTILPKAPTTTAHHSTVLTESTQSLFTGQKSIADVLTHFSTLSRQLKEKCLIEAALLAANGIPSVFIRSTSRDVPLPADSSQWEPTWGETPSFAIASSVAAPLRSALLPCIPVLDANALVRARADFLQHFNICEKPQDTPCLHHAALTLGKELNEISLAFQDAIDTIERSVTESTQLSDVVDRIRRAGEPLCAAASVLWKIESTKAKNEAGSAPAVLFAQPAGATKGIAAFIDILYDFWQTSRGSTAHEALAGSLLTACISRYVGLVNHWMESGAIPETLWKAFYNDTDADLSNLKVENPFPQFLRPVAREIVRCGIAAQHAAKLSSAWDPSAAVEQAHAFPSTPSFDARFVNDLHESVRKHLQRTSRAAMRALRDDFGVQSFLQKLHSVLFGVANDWMGIFLSDCWPGLAQPALLANGLSSLTASMRRVLVAECAVPVDFAERFALFIDEATVSGQKDKTYGQRVFAHMQVKVTLPAILEEIHLFLKSAAEAYCALFRVLFRLKTLHYMLGAAWSTGIQLAKSRGDAETEGVRRLIRVFQKFVRHMLTWMHASCGASLQALDAEMASAASIPACVDIHLRFVQSMQERFFMGSTKQTEALAAVITIIEKTLVQMFGLVTSAGALCISDVLVDGRRVDFSDLTADKADTSSQGEGFARIEKLFVHAVHDLFDIRKKGRATDMPELQLPLPFAKMLKRRRVQAS